MFRGLPNLKTLSLNNNPIVRLASHVVISYFVESIDLSKTLLEIFESEDLSGFPNMTRLNLSHSRIHTIGRTEFHATPELVELDLRGCPLKNFTLDVFEGLRRLSNVYSPDYRLCCERVIPRNLTTVCAAPTDVLSGCGTLLKLPQLQALFFIVTVVAVTGNVVCIVVRHGKFSETLYNPFGLLETSINTANFIMGVYTGVISAVNEVYRGEYVVHEKVWTKSVTCRTAGFLHSLSHHVSVFTILAASVSSLNALRFPCSRLRLQTRSSTVVSLVIWALAVGLAACPLVPNTPLSQLYALTGICVPMPATPPQVSGHYCHFSTVTLLNLLIGFLVCTCQTWNVIVLQQMRHCQMLRVHEDVVFASRFFLVAIMNTLCLAVFSVLGLLHTFAESEFQVILALLVVTVPSVINPVLLVVRRVKEDQRREKEARLLAVLRQKKHIH
jgi:hypothetical protein